MMAQIIDKPTTRYSDIELDYFKTLILKKRTDAENELDLLHQTLNNMIDADDADSSSNAHHFADVGTDEVDMQLHYSLIERTSSYINQLNQALERIENKTYGICRATGKLIPKGRLEAVPHTRYGIDAKILGLDKA